MSALSISRVNQSPAVLTPWRPEPAASPDPLTPTIFHESWWLDLATQGRWQMVESVHQGAVVGRLPYVRQERFNMPTIGMPYLSRCLGPAIIPGDGGPGTRLLQQIDIAQNLITQLPPDVVAVRQSMHRGITDVIAFQMEGFQSSVEFTCERPPAPPDRLWHDMTEATRAMICKASLAYGVGGTITVEEFLRFGQHATPMPGQPAPAGTDVAQALLGASLARGCGQIIAARDRHNVMQAAIACVWDRSASYLLLSARQPDSDDGAIALLLWCALQQASAGGLAFDLGGVADEATAALYLGLGAEFRPRYVVSKASVGFRLMQKGMRLLGRLNQPRV